MSKGIIVVVECISSAVNYVKDIYDEGYEPLLLEPYCRGPKRSYMRKFHDFELEAILGPEIKRPKIIMAKSSYEDTLKMMREYSPKYIIPGSDSGIELATKLAYDLGLVCNDPKNLPKMRNKFIAQEALRKAGVRSIKSRMVNTYNEALDFYKEVIGSGKKAVVVKPASGISSIGVFICKTEDELKKAYDSNKRNPLYAMYDGGNSGKVLIQECIDGVEYIVNSISYNGNHKITRVARYAKTTLPGKGRIYDYTVDLRSDDPITKVLGDYQLKVLEAIGITYGATHSEVMVDEDGPVLIEANCRLAGATTKSEYQEESHGFAESRYSLQSYLYPESMTDPNTIIFKDIKIFANKNIRLNKSTYITQLFLDDVVKGLKCARSYVVRKKKGFFSETINLSTDLATIYLVCDSEEELNYSIQFLKDLENNHPEKLYKSIDIPIICKIAGKLMV